MAIAVGNSTAAKLIAASTERHVVEVHNTGTNPVSIAKTSAVTAGSGFTLAAAGVTQVDLAPGEELYGICGPTFTSTVEVL